MFKLISERKDQPFFIQVSHYAVHTPIQAIQEVADKYKFKEGMSETNRKYAAMVESIDDCMRDMLAELKKHGIDKNTLIIFTSDNGGLDRNGSPTENAPLRSGKGYCYEGGIRVPFLVRWQQEYRRRFDFPVSSIDLFPTLWKPPDGSSQGSSIDGLYCIRIWKAEARKAETETLIWHFQCHAGFLIIRRVIITIKFWEEFMSFMI